MKQVLNVNDSNMGGYKYTINISGNNTVSGVKRDNTTCSSLYGFGGKANTNNTGRLDVNIDGTLVWQDGKMVSHKHSAGEQDNAFKYSYGRMEKQRRWHREPRGNQDLQLLRL